MMVGYCIGVQKMCPSSCLVYLLLTIPYSHEVIDISNFLSQE